MTKRILISITLAVVLASLIYAAHAIDLFALVQRMHGR
jgi:hypothetical protein